MIGLKMSENSRIIPYYKPRKIDRDRFYSGLDKVMESGWYSNGGDNVCELERNIAGLHGVKHCIAVCNGTVGLQLALKGLDISGEVITTPFSFLATVHAIRWVGLAPVFCDIDPITLTLSPEKLVEKVSKRTSCILGVHVFGQVCDVDVINKLAQQYNLKIIYDAAHSFMTSYRGVSIGNFGNAEVLSFHATKLFHTFEGGAILTNDSELAKKLRSLRNFGINGTDHSDYLGTNAKMNEVSAVCGLSMLPEMPKVISKLKSIHSKYASALNGVRGVSHITFSKDISHNGQYFPIFIDKELFGINRDQLWAYLWSRGIQSRRYFYPTLNMSEPYRSSTPQDMNVFPVSERVSESVLCLPCYFDLSDAAIQRISETIIFASKNTDQIISWYKCFLEHSCDDFNLGQVHKVLKRTNLHI